MESEEMEGRVLGGIGDGNIIIRLTAFKNTKYIDIRKYFKDDSGEMKPTKKGISLNNRQYEELLTFLNDKKAEIQAHFG